MAEGCFVEVKLGRRDLSWRLIVHAFSLRLLLLDGIIAASMFARYFISLLLCPVFSVAAQGQVGTTHEFRAIRLTADQLQAALSDVVDFVASANGVSDAAEFSISLEHDGEKVSVTDVGDLVTAMSRIGSATQLHVYFHASSRAAPITNLTARFHNYSRDLTVEGTSSVQVDACASLARDRLGAHETAIGGFGTQFAFVATLVLADVCHPISSFSIKAMDQRFDLGGVLVGHGCYVADAIRRLVSWV